MNAQFIQEEEQSGTHYPAPTFLDRTKYFAGGAIGAGALSAFIGLGEYSIIPAVVVGGIAAYLSPGVRGSIIDHAPAPQGVSSRREKLRFWLTGERGSEEEDAIDVPRSGGQDKPMEPLQPMARPQLAAPSVAALRAPSQQKSYFTLSDILRKGFRPSLQKIYLATLEDGTDVYVRADQLCHVAGAGLTRGGKGHIKRSLMAQLCYAGAEVYLLDPKYTRWDRNSVDPTGKPCPEDWTPYTPFLQNDPMDLVPIATKYQVIEHYLKEAKRELDQRLEAYGYSRSTGRPMFLFLDEMPDIVDNIPNAQTYLKSILRMGAGVGVYVVCLSQDFLVKTLFPGEGGAVRDCFRTVFYVGGDPTTAKILLDMPAKDVPENNLGKGRIMLRCDVVRPAQLARFPYGDNQALYDLIGPSTYIEPEEEEDLVSDLMTPQLKPVTGEYSTPRAQQSRPDALKLYDSGVRLASRKAERIQRLRAAAPLPSQPVQEDLPPELQRAYSAFESQMSYRDLGARLGVSKDTAGKWVLRLQDLGYISKDGMKLSSRLDG